VNLEGEQERVEDTAGLEPDGARARVLKQAAKVKASETHDEMSSASDRVVLDTAENRFRHGDHAGSVAAYDTYLQRHPDDVVTWNNRGVVFDASGDHASAVKSYRRAVELQPNYEVAWCNQANSYTYLEKREEAVKCYLQSIRVNRRYRPAYDYLVQLLLVDASPKDVLRRLQELETEMGETAYFKYHQGLLWDELGKPRRAVRQYGRALDLDPEDPEIWKAKGNAHFNLEELDLAIECYDEALNRTEVSPSSPRGSCRCPSTATGRRCASTRHTSTPGTIWATPTTRWTDWRRPSPLTSGPSRSMTRTRSSSTTGGTRSTTLATT
jgi:Flp pilus assembly protein TadD